MILISALVLMCFVLIAMFCYQGLLKVMKKRCERKIDVYQEIVKQQRGK